MKWITITAPISMFYVHSFWTVWRPSTYWGEDVAAHGIWLQVLLLVEMFVSTGRTERKGLDQKIRCIKCNSVCSAHYISQKVSGIGRHLYNPEYSATNHEQNILIELSECIATWTQHFSTDMTNEKHSSQLTVMSVGISTIDFLYYMVKEHLCSRHLFSAKYFLHHCYMLMMQAQLHWNCCKSRRPIDEIKSSTIRIFELFPIFFDCRSLLVSACRTVCNMYAYVLAECVFESANDFILCGFIIWYKNMCLLYAHAVCALIYIIVSDIMIVSKRLHIISQFYVRRSERIFLWNYKIF